MIDTHCHLLPAVDDGPRTLDEAVALARELVEAGVTIAVCTPHRSRRYPTDMSLAQTRLGELERALSDAGIGLELRLSTEFSPPVALSTDTAELGRLAIGGRYVLVELEPDTPASVVPVLVEHFTRREFLPIFAHPERCRGVVRDGSSLGAAREAGAIVQVVANSLSGAWGGTVARAAFALLETDRADVIASDAHRPGRKIRLNKVLSALSERLGDDTVDRLVSIRPRALLEGG
jgi:protein-tyrosine phosphatase